MKKKIILSLIFVVAGIAGIAAINAKPAEKKANQYYSHTDNTPLKLSNDQWKKVLTSDQYYIAREMGTETPYTGKYWDNHKKGMYYCGACGHPLFSSDAKFNSGTGWPSFFEPLNKNSTKLVSDPDGSRTEVECARCSAHLGHVFDDGPKPTGKRFCMDGNILDFEAAK